MSKGVSGVVDDGFKADILIKALPYIKEFAGETFVIKYGGSAINGEIIENFAKNVVLLKSVGINIVVVHGGGQQINEMLEKLGIKSKFIDGLRVTDEKTIEVVEMVLCGKINKSIVKYINKHGCSAIGLSGKDANLIKAEKISATYKQNKIGSNVEEIVNLGYVGKPSCVNVSFFDIMMEDTDIIPVIAPIGIGEDGNTYNMNADTVAGAIAVALGARKLILLTDVDGLLDENKNLISTVTKEQVKEMIAKEVIKDGMIPKIQTALGAVENGVGSVHIINGTKNNAILLEILTKDGTGTMITS